MSYVRAMGEDAPTVADKTPSYSRTTLSLLGVAALPWIPVAGGAYVGDRLLDKDGKIWGALGGFALSFFVLRHFVKKTSGVIT